MKKLEVGCLKIGRAPWPGRCHKAEFASGGGDAMQVKEKKLGQGVSIKNLKGAHLEVELQGNCNRSKCCRINKEKVHSGKARDGPRHGGESAKRPGERE